MKLTPKKRLMNTGSGCASYSSTPIRPLSSTDTNTELRTLSQKIWVNGELVDDTRDMTIDDLKELKRWEKIQVDCPYCLLRTSMDRFATFIQGTKKYPNKLSRKKMRCPECGEGVLITTLLKITNMSVEDFAYWFWENVFLYRMMERVKGDNFFGRIKLWRWEDRNVFWAIYKEFKNSPDRTGVRQRKEEDDAAYAEYERAYKAGELDYKDEPE